MQTPTETTRLLSPADVAARPRGERPVRLLDVRTPGEYAAVHIPGAYNVPLDALGAHARAIRDAVAAPVILVCQSGQRARRAEATLRAAGLDDLHVLDGGVNAWVAAGLPVERGAPRLSLERQVRIAAGALAALGGFLGAFVHPLWALLPAFVGSGLVFAGVTDTCGMALLLARLPYNRGAACDVGVTVRALAAPAPRPRAA